MLNSTFSTDTGYETETNVNPVAGDEMSQLEAQNKPNVRKVIQQQQQQPHKSNFIIEGSKCADTQAASTSHSSVPSPGGCIPPIVVECDASPDSGMCPEGPSAGQPSFKIPCETTSDANPLQFPKASTDVPVQLGEKTGTEELKRQLSLDVDDVVPPRRMPNDKNSSCPSNDKTSGTSTGQNACPVNASTKSESPDVKKCQDVDESVAPSNGITNDKTTPCTPNASTDSVPGVMPESKDAATGNNSAPSSPSTSTPSPANTPSQELVEIKYMQLSLSIVLAIVLHAMQSISQFMLEVFLSTDHDDPWDKM